MNKYYATSKILDMYEMCMKAEMVEEAEMYRLQFVAAMRNSSAVSK